MPTYYGNDATITHTITNLKVNSWTLRKTSAKFDITGDADKQTVIGRGSRIVNLIIEGVVTGTTLPDEGDSFTASFDIDGGGVADIADTFVITDIDWDVNKNQGGPPQRCRIFASANEEGAGNSSAVDGVFA